MRRDKRKLDEADVEDVASDLQNMSLSPVEVATQVQSKRPRKTRSRRTKTQSQIGRRSKQQAKSHPKDLPIWRNMEESITAMLTSIRESMSGSSKDKPQKKTAESSAPKAENMSGSSKTKPRKQTAESSAPKTENKQPSLKRKGLICVEEAQKKRKSCTRETDIDDLVHSFRKLTLGSH